MWSASKFDESMEERTHRRMQVLYSHKMHERQLFMDDLKTMRNARAKRQLRMLQKAIGPKWYQALSCAQRDALRTLEKCIYNDLLEGRPVRTMGVIKALDIYPRPKKSDLMECLYVGRDDPKQMLAHLFLIYYGHTFDGKQLSYCLNARLMLSSILYLGIDNLIYLLQQRFKPDEPPLKLPPKPKRKPAPQAVSPYLERLKFVGYTRKERKPFKPLPFPNMDELNDEAYEEDIIISKPPPPPPPPPPPKKVLPRSYCDKLAGMMYVSPLLPDVPQSPTIKSIGARSKRGVDYTEDKKVYGMGSTTRRTGRRKKKPVTPSTGLWNSQYTINGVYTINGKTVFVLGNVSILPPLGDIIHGGIKCVGGQCININLGVKGYPAPPKPPPCDCLKKYQDRVIDYVKNSKCYCGHHYDYKNEGTFPPDELPYFTKPTKYSSFGFDFSTIYDTNEKRLVIDKQFKKVWDTTSVLNENVEETTEKKDKKKKKRTKENTDSCLGETPRPEDYLRCALRILRRVNIAACLPDIHLVPELKEWMRRRMYGPLSRLQKLNTLYKSNKYWALLESLENKCHIEPPYEKGYIGLSNWVHKQRLNNTFKGYTQAYRCKLFRKYAYLANLMWPSFFQAQFPNEKFREIYFSYVYSRIEDLQILHPYSSRETIDRYITVSHKRYCCVSTGNEKGV